MEKKEKIKAFNQLSQFDKIRFNQGGIYFLIIISVMVILATIMVSFATLFYTIKHYPFFAAFSIMAVVFVYFEYKFIFVSLKIEEVFLNKNKMKNADY